MGNIWFNKMTEFVDALELIVVGLIVMNVIVIAIVIVIVIVIVILEIAIAILIFDYLTFIKKGILKIFSQNNNNSFIMGGFKVYIN